MLDFSEKVDMFLDDDTFLDDYLDYTDKKNLGTPKNNVSYFPGFQNSILDASKKKQTPLTKNKYDIINTKSIYEKVSKKVVGQDDVVRAVLATIIRNRMITVPDLKSNIFLLGGTGTGKTLVASTICKELDIPFTIEDASIIVGAIIGIIVGLVF